ncbi:MAG: glycosyltransferase [Flavobacteriales bacterium]|nr:glycosyltransferase [Flavobacteriales bacterium]
MGTHHIAVIAPCYNEGDVAVRFVEELEQMVAALPISFTIVVVDDASTDGTLALLSPLRTRASNVSFKALSLPYNMGHQEAIYHGLLFASSTTAQHFIVMDSDGEDDPKALVELVQHIGTPIVLVARGKRSESVLFRLGYWSYRMLFRAFTGRSITFGNFSMIDRQVLGAVLDRSFIHYAAFLSRQKAKTAIITYDRRKRLDGNSKMSFKSLSYHAFRSLIEYSEEVLSMFLKVLLALTGVFLCSIIVIMAIKLFTDQAIPGWASTLILSMFNSLLLCLGFFAIGLLLVNTSQRKERAGKQVYPFGQISGQGSK